MAQKASTSKLGSVVLQQLSHPIKLRLALCAALVVAWQVLFFGPLANEVTATTARVARERQRSATARRVVALKKSLAPHQDDIGSADGLDELMRFVLARIRTSPLRLIDLIPEKAKELGPFQAIHLKLKLTGSYNDLDDFLGWVETNRRLLRVDSLALKPDSRDPVRLDATLTLVALAEKAAPSPAKTGARSASAARPKAPGKPASKAPTRPSSKAAPRTTNKVPPKGRKTP